MDYLIGLVLGLLLVVGLFFGGKALVKRLLFGAFTGLFDSKSKVLRDASLVIHGIEPVATPKPGPAFNESELAQWLSAEDLEVERVRHAEETAADARRLWFDLDVTITPKPSPGPFQLWDPTELAFCLPSVQPRDALKEDDHGPEGPEPATIRRVRVWHDGKFRRDYADKLPGEQRVLLRLGVLPEHPELKLFYYLDTIGLVRFPVSGQAP